MHILYYKRIENEQQSLCRKKAIEPGSMDHEHILLLAELSRINSQRIISALDDHLVGGMSRKDACKK
ncbi:PapB/FocB family fimbrial expression transcriptional regulator [Escherichia coli]|uniref:PapB/FocB family fimbrial expression transcriptional regulator n=1 Tax=Escherichia coli TaxID=562 RepID=UPI003CC91F83